MQRSTEHFVFDAEAKTTGSDLPQVQTDQDVGGPSHRRVCYLQSATATSVMIGCISTFATKPKPLNIVDSFRIDRTTGRGEFKSTHAPQERIQCIPDRKLF